MNMIRRVKARYIERQVDKFPYVMEERKKELIQQLEGETVEK